MGKTTGRGKKKQKNFNRHDKYITDCNDEWDLLYSEECKESNKRKDVNIYANGRWEIDGHSLFREYYTDDIIEWWDSIKKYHRVDGPVIERSTGHKEWWQHGKRHRIDGPAVENIMYKEWWVNGKNYRIDGPIMLEYDDMCVYYDTESYKLLL